MSSGIFLGIFFQQFLLDCPQCILVKYTCCHLFRYGQLKIEALIWLCTGVKSGATCLKMSVCKPVGSTCNLWGVKRNFVNITTPYSAQYKNDCIQSSTRKMFCELRANPLVVITAEMTYILTALNSCLYRNILVALLSKKARHKPRPQCLTTLEISHQFYVDESMT